ncbi:Zinc finger protein CONSTANS-LIKE 5 [Linum perenne]
MSSDLFVLDDSNFFHHSSNIPDITISSSSDGGGGDIFFSDQLCSSFNDGSFLDIFQEFKSVADSTNFSPSNQLQSLKIGYENGVQPENFYSGGELEVKSEECQMGLESLIADDQNYSMVDNTNSDGIKMMQRSYSGDSFVDSCPAFFLQPKISYQNQLLSSPESNFLAGQLRRVCSTGDLQNTRRSKMTQRSLSSPLAMENSCTEESQMKVGRYSAEERQERISKYRAKRSQRNFNKTIKYACRKTLADNRPRIRGRFARNDDIYCENIPKVAAAAAAACSSRDDEEDDLWLDGLHEEEGEGCYGEAQFQFYGY